MKILLALILIILLIAGGVYYYKTRSMEERFLNLPVQFTARTHSLKKLSVVPLYQDPEKSIAKKGVGKNPVPDEIFQSCLPAGENVDVVGCVSIKTSPGENVRFCLVRSSKGFYGYLPEYALCGPDGSPLRRPPRKGPVY